MENVVKIGMADLRVSKHPSMLTTLGLGSCVGVALYDPMTKVAGLAHIMLPSSAQVRNNSNIAKFADTAIDKVIDDMIKLGAYKVNITAKLAGGAQMFNFNPSSEMMRVGLRNVLAAKEKLHDLGIPVISEDTGGNYGRTIELYSDDGRLIIKTIGHGIKVI
jgi:chemotaxis protein CheD